MKYSPPPSGEGLGVREIIGYLIYWYNLDMSQALYRKWRPHFWEDIVGQEHIVQTLRNAITADRVAHAQLFAGPRGTGKTTTARLLAKAVNCLAPDLAVRPCDQCDHCQAVNQGRFLDLIEIDAASNTSVEDVRDLRDKINFSPNQGRFKVYIIDEVHMLSTTAFNALLKTLEEPPSHAIFILATTEVHKIPATVLSRCQRHEFRRIPVADIVAYLSKISKEEKIKIEPEALTLVARQSTGSMRDAISLLDQLSSSGKKVSLELAQSVLGTATSQSVLDVWEALVAKDAAAGLDQIHKTLDAGSDPRQFARQVVDYIRNLLLVQMGNADQVDVTPEIRLQMAQHAHAFPVNELLRILRVFNQAATESRAGWIPSLPLEMAFVEALEAPLPPAAPLPPVVETKKPAQVEQPPAPAVKPSRPAASGESQEATAPPPPEKAGKVAAAPVETEAASTPAEAQLLDENWKNILSLTRQQNPNTYGILNSCKSRRLSNGILALGFASDVLRFQMEKSNNLEIVQGVLKQLLKMDIQIRCFTVSGKQNTPPPGVDSDGMVASALRDLGGEIVDVS